MKHYLIDSENVGDFWIPLLELPADQAELIVFYTKNSPHMSYDSLIKLKESDRTVTFIKCYEGTNALDFQLCSELGYLIAMNKGDDFIIVTNDTGYDAAVKYWRHKEYSVKRIAGKDSRSGGRRRSTARTDVAGEVSAILNRLVRMPDAEEKDAEEDVKDAVSAVYEADVPEDTYAEPAYEEEEETADYEETSSEDAEDETEDAAYDPAEETDPYEDGSFEPEEEDSEDGTEEEEPEEGDLPEAEDDSVNEEEPDQEPLYADADAATEEDGEENAAASKAYEAENEENAPEEAQEAGNGLPSETETDDAGPIAQETAEAPYFGADPEEITVIVNCIGMENLAELHNQLIQFYGDSGKDIYLSIKSGALTIENQNWDKEDKFLYYSALIFRHSDEPEEELSEENIREFAEFILGAENKRRNLNSLRYALLKRYGKEKGRRYYFMLKPYVKALNQM
jgi:hypothetical protein